MRQNLRVVAIDPNLLHARHLEQCLLCSMTYDVDFVHVDRPAFVLGPEHARDADVVFIDYDLHAVTGLEVIAAARASGERRPIVATTAQDSGYLASELIHAGADGYLAKPDCTPQRVSNLLARAIERNQERVKQVYLRRDAIRELLRDRAAALA